MASQVAHARGYVGLLPDDVRRGVDLGSGAGVPGLVVAAARPEADWTLVESDGRRAAFLQHAVAELGLANVAVRHERAEIYGRGDGRGDADVVCARSFGAPSVVAECAAPLLVLGGSLIVSDPPTGGADRWPAEGLAVLGLAVVKHTEEAGGHFTVLHQARSCPVKFPRRPGVPERRRLF